MKKATYVVDITDEDGKRRTVEVRTMYVLEEESHAKTLVAHHVRTQLGIDVARVHSFKVKP